MAGWYEITSVDEWKQLLSKSMIKNVLVLKHSTSCPISANAWRQFDLFVTSTPRSDTDYVLVKVIESRDVSNQIADDLSVPHQSPQLILIENKQAVWDTSHWNITQENIRNRLHQIDSTGKIKELFSYYYRHNSWGSEESRSGTGSTLYESRELISNLPTLLKQLQVKTILDASCGDFNWMKEINLDDYHYTGVDIVHECIEDNQSKYQKNNIIFLEKDIVTDPLPSADIILCRDALVHFPNQMVKDAIHNFKQSGSTYLLTTHFTNTEANFDIQVGDWRPINFTLAPFELPAPLFMIKETLPIKTMALWKLDEL